METRLIYLEEFYPYESDGREFFKDNARSFRQRHISIELLQFHRDRCGIADFAPHVYNRMTLPKKWNPELFDSSDDSGPEALQKYNDKMKERKPDKYQAVGDDTTSDLFYTTWKATSRYKMKTPVIDISDNACLE
ncbi:hypothetical protein MMC27_008079 [Xylographa pallens]|nr:hypothetical protein [Xylographa pallens]